VNATKLSGNPDIPVLAGWITIPEAASKLGISRQYAYKRAAEGFFSSIHQIGEENATFVVSTDEVDKKLAARKEKVEVSG
jgi:predicted DNA-binding transcriptional regulator AlpA